MLSNFKLIFTRGINKKIIRRISIFIFAFVFLTPTVLAQEPEVKHIPSFQYFEATLNEINQAKESIQVFMYLISIFPDQPESQVNKLVEALIKAKDRGVTVRVILDQNLDFTEEIHEEALYQNKNQASYELLKRNGIPVFFDEAQVYTHAKAIIIDEETVILGSTNWSKAALTRNNEANALIRSKELARNLLDDLKRVKLQEVPALLTPGVRFPEDFLLKKNFLGEMVSRGDERVFGIHPI